MSFWALVDLPRLRRWSRGRVMLLGDAAHAPLPHQGQGAGLAIEDAYALSALIANLGLKDYGRAFGAFVAVTDALFVKRAGRGPRMVLLHSGMLPGELCWSRPLPHAQPKPVIFD